MVQVDHVTSDRKKGFKTEQFSKRTRANHSSFNPYLFTRPAFEFIQLLQNQLVTKFCWIRTDFI